MASPGKGRFWLLRFLNTVAGALLTAIVANFATLPFETMGVMSASDQRDLATVLGFAGWIGWLIYLLHPLFRGAAELPSFSPVRDLVTVRLLGAAGLLLLAGAAINLVWVPLRCVAAPSIPCDLLGLAAPVVADLAAAVFVFYPLFVKTRPISNRTRVVATAALIVAALALPLAAALIGLVLAPTEPAQASAGTAAPGNGAGAAMQATTDEAPAHDPALDAGMAAFEKGDYATALALWRPLAEQGNAEAQTELANLYANGFGVTASYAEAIKWFRRAAAQGDAFAQTNLGDIYAQGLGVRRNDREAAKWFRAAAEQGDAYGQVMLGQMYLMGSGVAQDDALAADWFARAAEQGDAFAQVKLGELYLEGRGVPQDSDVAIAWFRDAAKQGDETALKWLDHLGVEATPEPEPEPEPEAEDVPPTGGMGAWPKFEDINRMNEQMRMFEEMRKSMERSQYFNEIGRCARLPPGEIADCLSKVGPYPK